MFIVSSIDWAYPDSGTFIGLGAFVALWVMINVPFFVPLGAEGLKLTVTNLDCPGERLKEPPPLTIVKSVPLMLTSLLTAGKIPQCKQYQNQVKQDSQRY